MLYHEDYPHGGDRYSRPLRLDFSANTNPLGTHPAVREAMVEASMILDHYPDAYCRELVSAIAECEGVPEEYILCGNGAADLIDLYIRALAPRVAMVAAPTFAEYERSLTAPGCETKLLYLKGETHFQWDRSALDEIRSCRSDLLILCSPNNPTGQLIPPEILTEILDLTHEIGTKVLLDECFIDLADRQESRKGDLPLYRHLTLLHAFTKSHGLAGLRLGYCLTAESDLLARMSRLSQPWNVSIPAQLAGVVAAHHPEHIAEARALIRTERPRLRQALEALGLETCPSDVNFLLFHGPKGLDKQLLEEGIAIRSCANYHGLEEGWYRIAIRRREENDILLNTLSEVLKRP